MPCLYRRGSEVTSLAGIAGMAQPHLPDGRPAQVCSRRLASDTQMCMQLCRYGIIITGACQNAAFCAFGSRTVTSQSYSPGLSLLNEKSSFTGSICDFGSSPP